MLPAKKSHIAILWPHNLLEELQFKFGSPTTLINATTQSAYELVWDMLIPNFPVGAVPLCKLNIN